MNGNIILRKERSNITFSIVNEEFVHAFYLDVIGYIITLVLKFYYIYLEALIWVLFENINIDNIVEFITFTAI